MYILVNMKIVSWNLYIFTLETYFIDIIVFHFQWYTIYISNKSIYLILRLFLDIFNTK